YGLSRSPGRFAPSGQQAGDSQAEQTKAHRLGDDHVGVAQAALAEDLVFDGQVTRELRSQQPDREDVADVEVVGEPGGAEVGAGETGVGVDVGGTGEATAVEQQLPAG